MEQYAVEYEHRAPESPRTQYLPLAHNGDIDTPDDGEAVNSVDTLDKKIDAINAATMNYDPHSIFSFCDDGCGGGCVKSAQHVPVVAGDKVLAAMQHFVDTLGHVGGALHATAGEQNVDRLATVYADRDGFDMQGIINRTNEVADAFKKAAEASNTSAEHSLNAVRLTVKATRSKLAERADVVHWSAGDIAKVAITNALPIPLMGKFPKLGGPWTLAAGAAVEVFMAWRDRRKAQGLGPEEVEQGQAAAMNALAENDEAVKALKSEIPKLSADPNATALNIPVKAQQVASKGKVEDPEDPEITDPGTPPVALPAPSGETPPLSGDKPTTTKEDLQKWLDGLKDDKPTSNPLGNSGMPGGGSPMGGGMPSMPSMGGMPGGGSPFGDTPLDGPLGDEPLDAPADDDLDDEPMEADGDELTDEGDGDTTDEAVEGENLEGDDEPKDDEPKDGLDAAVPVSQSDAPVAADSNSPEARTVTMPDGKQVVFPTGHQADAARSMLDAAGQGNPKSLYMAASEAGYQLPPQGQDIGEKVPPSLMQTGDVVSTATGQGMYVGDGNVLMESGEVKPLSEVANFDGESQGVFRMTEPEANDGQPPAQPVSAEAAQTVAQPAAAQPGVPTDSAEATTAQGALDPNSAFPN